MKFQEILTRLTGISCPVFGLSWNPSETEMSISRRVLTFLEDRRVLYVPSEIEIPDHCVRSVLQIRNFITDELAKLDAKDELAQDLRAMRAACRKFLNDVKLEDKNRIIQHGNHPGHYASWTFNQSIGEMRGVFGIHVARIATRNGLDIEDDLAKILPVLDED